MAVGAGLILAGVCLTVTADAIRLAGPVPMTASLLGAAVFSASNACLAPVRRRPPRAVRRLFPTADRVATAGKRSGDRDWQRPGRGARGAGARRGAARSRDPLALTIAFWLGNLPVALSSTAGMRAAGRSYPYIVLAGLAITLGAAAAIAAG